MNFDAPPKTSAVKVWLFVLGGLGLLLVSLVVGAYYVLMHTAVPLRMFASMFTSGTDGENVRIDGISGSISKGFKVKTIQWGKEGMEASEIRDVSIAYNNFWDLMGGQRVVFKEIRVGKAHLDVTGLEQLALPDISDDSSVYSDTNWGGGSNMAAWTNSFAARRSRRSAARRGLGLFQLDRVSVEDVFLTNRANGFSLSVPAIEWKGFKVMDGKVELGELKIDSDRLKVTTKPAEEVELNGKKVAFQKRLEGTILPRFHPAVRQPIAFTVDVGHTGKSLFWRMKAFEGKLQASQLEDQTGFVRCEDLDLAAYLNAPVPQHLSMDAFFPEKHHGEQALLNTGNAASSKDLVKLSKGSFKLGLMTFEIEPLELDRSDETMKTNGLVAIGRSGTNVITYHLIVPDRPWKVEQRLTAEPPMTTEDTLARVFYEKPFAELTDVDQAAVKKMKTGFGGWPVAEEEEGPTTTTEQTKKD